MAPVVLAQHVTKWYGPRRAVADVSFAIEPGEIVGLLGPNGSGKSTIFRTLTGYLAPSSGRVEVAGHDVVTDLLAVRQAISYVPEDAPLYDHMHVAEFLHFMARIKGLRGAAKKKAVEAAAGRLDLSRVMSLPTGKLSRGFQRVSIASALFRPALVRRGAGRHRPVRFRAHWQSGGRRAVLLSVFLLLSIIDNFGWLLPKPFRHARRQPVALGAFQAVRGRLDLSVKIFSRHNPFKGGTNREIIRRTCTRPCDDDVRACARRRSLRR